MLTGGLFAVGWLFVQARFATRLSVPSQALKWYAGLVASVALQILSQLGWFSAAGDIWSLVATLCYIMTLVDMHRVLEKHYNTAEPIHLEVNPVLAYLFGPFYVQMKLNEVTDHPPEMRLS